MVLVTLIGESQAHIGNRFYYLGPITSCKECRLKGVCFNLELGSLYEVTALRDTMHDCLEYESGARVVEVEKIPAIAAVAKKQAIDGSMITFQSGKCENYGCEYWFKCHPVGIKDGQKLSITEIIEDIDSPCEESLVLVKLV